MILLILLFLNCLVFSQFPQNLCGHCHCQPNLSTIIRMEIYVNKLNKCMQIQKFSVRMNGCLEV
uniref:Secreted protein n=1 Tax=Rhizophora mucronata TaxID=61149 RepID=A0A2P2MDT0_RHIMU